MCFGQNTLVYFVYKVWYWQVILLRKSAISRMFDVRFFTWILKWFEVCPLVQQPFAALCWLMKLSSVPTIAPVMPLLMKRMVSVIRIFSWRRYGYLCHSAKSLVNISSVLLMPYIVIQGMSLSYKAANLPIFADGNESLITFILLGFGIAATLTSFISGKIFDKYGMYPLLVIRAIPCHFSFSHRTRFCFC